MALVLRILDENHFDQTLKPNRHGCIFQKDRRVSVSYHDRFRPSLEHRRLRFSFQIYDFKDPTSFRQHHRLTPVIRRRRRYSRLGFPCQAPLFQEEIFRRNPLPGGGGGRCVVLSFFRVKRALQRISSFFKTPPEPGSGHVPERVGSVGRNAAGTTSAGVQRPSAPSGASDPPF